MAAAVTGNDKITGGIVMIGAIFIIAVLAGINDQLAKVLMIFMLGMLLLWVMTGGASILQAWVGKIPSSNAPVTLQ